MSFYLYSQGDGALNEFVNFTKFTIPSSEDFTIRIKGYCSFDSHDAIVGETGAFNNSIVFVSNSSIRIELQGSGSLYFDFITPLNVDEVYDFEIQRVGGSTIDIVDTLTQSSIVTATVSSSNQFALNSFFREGNSSHDYKGGLNLFQVTSSTVNHKWDADASNHNDTAAQPVLVDTIGGNNATGVNFPTDGSAWVDLGGGELNVVGSTPSYSFAVPLADVDLTGELNIVGSTPSYSFAVPLANVDLTGELNVVGSTPSYSFAVPLADVDLTGELNIVGSTPSYSFSVPLADVDLTGELNIVGSTPSYSYTVPLANVDLTGELNVVGSTPSYSYTVPLADVDLTGELNIVGSTPSYSYTVPLASVDLTGELNIVGSTPSYSYAVPLANVDLTGDLSIVGTTPTYSYTAVRGVVSFSGGACLEIKGDITLNSKQFSCHDHKAPVACFESISGSVTIDSFNK